MLQIDLRELARGPVDTRADVPGTDPLFEGVNVELSEPVRVAGRLQDAGDGRFYWRGSLIGIVTHRELLRFLIPSFIQRTKTGEFRAPSRSQVLRGSADPQLIPVREAMARSVLCLAEDQTLADVANLMSGKDVDRFPVVREGVVVGFLTRADLVRRLITP